MLEDHGLAAIGGLNQDPYLQSPGIGRVRHLYVDPEYRRRGYARSLTQAIKAAGKAQFRVLRLRTRNPEAVRFYESLGFEAVEEESATHRWVYEAHPLAPPSD